MKRYFAFALTVLLAFCGNVRGQGLDDQYFSIFSAIQEADNLSASEPAKALAKYRQAQTTLQAFKQGNPDWNPQVVAYRLSYLAQQVAALSSKAPVPSPAAAETNKTIEPAPMSTQASASTNALFELQSQVNALKEQVKQMLS